jgi:hypothetical protein
MKVKKLFEGTQLELHKKLMMLLQDIRNNFNNIDFRAHVQSKNKIYIDFIGSKVFGDGPKALQKLCNFADENYIILILSISDDFGSSSNQLLNGYGKFGFMLDTEYKLLMVREPK